MSFTVNWKILVDKFHSKLFSWKTSLLSFGGRLTLIKAVLGSLGSQGSKKLAWMKWSNILASFDKGDSLWVKVIRALHGNEGGFDRNGCKFNGLWSRIVGSSNYLHSSSILPMDSIRFQVGCGSLIHFWKDIWLGKSPLYMRLNRLFRLEQEKNCLIIDRIHNGQWSWNWSQSVLGVRNSAHLNNILLEISQIEVGEDKDKCVWFLAHDGVFSVGDLCRRIDDHILPSVDTKTTWDKSLPRKVNIFM
ncbi:hypothetical protein Tco_1505944 [Tanacetum coccineum]